MNWTATRRVILAFIILLPILVMADEVDSGGPKEQANATGTGNGVTQSQSGRISLKPSLHTGALLAFGQQSNAPPPAPSAETKKPPQPREETERPRIEGSMVGYIDNAIIGSQIRLRFDAAFNDQFPDRSEFFYAKCSCYKNLGLDPNPPGPGTGIPKKVNFQQLYFDGEYAPSRRFSFFTEIPIRWLQPQGFVTSPVTQANGFMPFPNESGLGDVMAGFKLAAFASLHHYLTFQLRAYFPSGDAARGLGANHYSIEPAVLYYHRLSERLAVEAQLRDWHPVGGSKPPPFTFAAPPQVNGIPNPNGVPTTSSDRFSGDVFIYGFGPSYQLYNGERFHFTPVLEFVGWRVLGGFQTAAVVDGVLQPGFSDANGTNIFNVKIGARTSWARHNSFYFGYGRALTSADWYEQIVRAEYRYSF